MKHDFPINKLLADVAAFQRDDNDRETNFLFDLLHRAHCMKRVRSYIGPIRTDGVVSAIEKAVKAALTEKATNRIRAIMTHDNEIFTELLERFIAMNTPKSGDTITTYQAQLNDYAKAILSDMTIFNSIRQITGQNVSVETIDR